MRKLKIGDTVTASLFGGRYNKILNSHRQNSQKSKGKRGKRKKV